MLSLVTVEALSDTELDTTEKEVEPHLEEIIPQAIGKKSTPREGGTRKQKNRQCV